MIIAVIVIMIIAVVVIMVIAVIVIMVVAMIVTIFTVIITMERHAKSAFDVRVRNTKMAPVPGLG